MSIKPASLSGPSTKGNNIKYKPDLNYLRRALGIKAVRLLDAFSAKKGRLVNKHYSAPISAQFGLKYTYFGQKVPPILMITPKELSQFLQFYKIEISAIESERFMQTYSNTSAGFLVLAQGGCGMRNLNYLENYLLIVKPNGKMIFISDDHSHAVYAFALAQHTGVIDKNSHLFHIDEHEDDALNPKLQKGSYSLGSLAHNLINNVQIDQETSFASQAGLFKEQNIHYTLSQNMKGEFFPRQYDDQKRFNGGNHLPFSRIQEVTDQIKRANQKIVMDFDIDYLAYLHEKVFPKNKREKLKDYTEDKVMPVLTELARRSAFITIATSPDYFAVDEAIVRRLIKTIVDAA